MPVTKNTEYQSIPCDKDVLVAKYEIKDCSKADNLYNATQVYRFIDTTKQHELFTEKIISIEDKINEWKDPSSKSHVSKFLVCSNCCLWL